MTLMETAQLLGNFGEFFGAVAVVATLAYLAVQIRQNNVLAKAETVNDIYRGWEAIYITEYETGIQELFIKSIEQPDDLTPSEIMKLSAYLNTIMNLYSRQSSMFFRYGLAYDPTDDLVVAAQHYFGGRFARAWFYENRDWLEIEPQMFEVISHEIEARPVQSKFEYMERLRSRH